MEALTKVSHKLAEEMYKSSAGAQPGAQPGDQPSGADAASGGDISQHTASTEDRKEDSSKKRDGVIDADFEVKDDKK